MVLSSQIQNKLAVVMGDYNCPGTNWESVSADKECYQLLNFYSENFLSQFVLEPTSEENILDIILVTQEDLIEEVVIGNSDHSTVQFKVAIEKNTREKFFTKLNYKKANWNRLTQKLIELFNTHK